MCSTLVHNISFPFKHTCPKRKKIQCYEFNFQFFKKLFHLQQSFYTEHHGAK